MVDWPDTALITWASRHLCIPSQHVPSIEQLDNRRLMINNMIRLGITRAKVFSEKSEVVIGPQADREEMLIETNSCSGATVASGHFDGLALDQARKTYWHDPNDMVVHHAVGKVVRHGINMAQAERMIVQNMGEKSLWGTIDVPEAATDISLKLREDRAAAEQLRREMYMWGTMDLPEDEVGHSIAERGDIDAPAAMNEEDELVVYNENDCYNEDDPDEMR